MSPTTLASKAFGLLAVSAALVSAQAFANPVSTLYVGEDTQVFSISNGVATSFGATGFGAFALAVDTTVRTFGYNPGVTGAKQYTLNGTATGVTYGAAAQYAVFDGTTDGVFNYGYDYANSNVYRYNTDWTNQTTLFNANLGGYAGMGITYDPTNNSLWVSSFSNGGTVRDYSMNGTLLSSFSLQTINSGEYTGLALDQADQTLWLVTGFGDGGIYQYKKDGTFVSKAFDGLGGREVLSAEFSINAAKVPEPESLALFGLGLLGLAMARRRKQ